MKKQFTNNRQISIEYGVPKVPQKLAKFMARNKAKRTSRYAINNVGVEGGVFVVTNGRTMLIVTPTSTFDPPIADGLYHLTGEGFLLNTESGATFPKYQDALPTRPGKLGTFLFTADSDHGMTKIFATFFAVECFLNIEWLLDALNGFYECGCDEVEIQDPEGNNAILITGHSPGANIQYIQMPINQR